MFSNVSNQNFQEYDNFLLVEISSPIFYSVHRPARASLKLVWETNCISDTDSGVFTSSNIYTGFIIDSLHE